MFKLLTTTALVLAAGSAFAADLGGELTVDIAENAAGDWGATTSFDLGLTVDSNAGLGMEFVIDQNGGVTLDGYSLGMMVSGAAISFGDQGNAWIDSENGATLADPEMAESLRVSAQGATIALGWADIGADIKDIENIQGRYGMDVGGMASVEAAGDYNLNTENWTLGGRADVFLNEGLVVGGAATYGSADEKLGFEADVTAFGITAYLNGDQDDMMQNIGSSYTYNLQGVELGTGVNYNFDAENFTPSVSVSFNF